MSNKENRGATEKWSCRDFLGVGHGLLVVALGLLRGNIEHLGQIGHDFLRGLPLGAEEFDDSRRIGSLLLSLTLFFPLLNSLLNPLFPTLVQPVL